MEQCNRVWFPAKADSKWLWDLPNCWQGWFVVVTWWLTLIAGTVYLATSLRPAIMLPTFIIAWSALLAAICFIKGERLTLWR